MAKKEIKQQVKQSEFPPVVAVLGHVDHGKTTLLDTFRKSSFAEREHGGITQKIGASSVEVEHEGKKRKITFIDTPGHQAFTNMRTRGAQAADLALLVVSSVDGVMPQTQESIQLLKATETPFIVVLTKSDSPEKNVEKVKQQILKNEVLLEGYGGNIPVIEVSARNGTNIKELLDLILLVFDFSEKKNDLEHFSGIIIESRLDERSGPKATMVVKSGSIKIKDEVVSGEAVGKIRSLADEKGRQLQEVGIGEAVEVLGFDKVPPVGSIVYIKGQEKESVNQEALNLRTGLGEDAILSILIVADTQGSLEAIVNSIPKERINIVMAKTGEVTTTDVLFAKSVGAIVLSFSTKIKPEVAKLAVTEKILVKNYTIIYEMLDEINDVLEGKELSLLEQVLGEAKILARFPFEKTEVLGIKVTSGRIAKGDRVRITRGEEIIGEANITSSRQGKDQVSKIEQGEEGGIIISPFLDFAIGDMVISLR